MIKCDTGNVELGVTSSDLEQIHKAIPIENMLDAQIRGILDKTTLATVLATDLRCIFSAIRSDLGEELAVEVITLAVQHTMDDIREGKSSGAKEVK